jgi:hypothetical protein
MLHKWIDVAATWTAQAWWGDVVLALGLLAVLALVHIAFNSANRGRFTWLKATAGLVVVVATAFWTMAPSVWSSSLGLWRWGVPFVLVSPLLLRGLWHRVSPLNHPDRDVRARALSTMTEEDLLLSVVENDDDDELRQAALARISTEATLVRIARTSSSPAIRQASVGRIADKVLLAEIAQADTSDVVRKAAVERVSDPAVLRQIAKTDSSHLVRVAAVNRIPYPSKRENQAIFTHIAKTDASEAVRKAAVNRIELAAVLAHVARHDTAQAVRSAAVARFDRPEVRANADAGLLAKLALELDAQPSLARAAQTLGANQSVHQWTSALQADDPKTRARAAEALLEGFSVDVLAPHIEQLLASLDTGKADNLWLRLGAERIRGQGRVERFVAYLRSRVGSDNSVMKRFEKTCGELGIRFASRRVTSKTTCPACGGSGEVGQHSDMGMGSERCSSCGGGGVVDNSWYCWDVDSGP